MNIKNQIKRGISAYYKAEAILLGKYREKKRIKKAASVVCIESSDEKAEAQRLIEKWKQEIAGVQDKSKSDGVKKLNTYKLEYATMPEVRSAAEYITFFDTLPIDQHMIVLYPENGLQIHGSIFYLLKEFAENARYTGFSLHLLINPVSLSDNQTLLESHNLLSKVHVDLWGTEAYYRALASAKFLISDNAMDECWIKKEGQVYLNTWHGTPLKTIGRYAKDNAFVNIGLVQKNLIEADYVLCPNDYVAHHLTRDYMVDSLALGQKIFGGLPKNVAFFDSYSREKIRKDLGISDKKVYAFMPTYRGNLAIDPVVTKSEAFLLWYLEKLDKNLNDDECLYVKLHKLCTVPFVMEDNFKHIRSFPREYESYEFLNACDALVTDYSGVLFDYLNTGRKVVLFPFDFETYRKAHGISTIYNGLSLPVAYDDKELLAKLRKNDKVDYSNIKEEYCKHENKDAARNLAEFFIFGNELYDSKPMKTDHRENVLIYAGPLSGNGITASLINLMNNENLYKRNYYIAVYNPDLLKYFTAINKCPSAIRYISLSSAMNLTYREKQIHDAYMGYMIDCDMFISNLKHRYEQEWLRLFGRANFAHVIQFNGYGVDSNMLFSTQTGKNTIYVHNDMQAEMKSKLNQHWDLLHYLYRTYRNVACVAEDIVDSTAEIAGTKENIRVCKNLININAIKTGAEKPLGFGKYTVCYPDEKAVTDALNDNTKRKLISVGRFSIEKAHMRMIDAFERLCAERDDVVLFIMGGYQNDDYFFKTRDYVMEKHLENKVFLILNQPNPFCVIKKCDGFILGSLYEGFGLVIVEADIVGLPVVSTDIVGPRVFMQKHKGVLVEDSEQGVYEGLKMLAEDRVKPLAVNYSSYNSDALRAFEKLL